MKAETTALYIRFGEIPENEKSKVYRGDVVLREEAGVSVWKAVQANGRYYPVLPDEPNEHAIADYFDNIMHCDRNVYLVTGTELCIEGADREPLLTNVMILKNITWMFNDKVNELANFTIGKGEVPVEYVDDSSFDGLGIKRVIAGPSWLDKILEFYETVRISTPNCSWDETYPNSEVLSADIKDEMMLIFYDTAESSIVAAFVMSKDPKDIDSAVFKRVAVHPSRQGCGLGALMIKWGINYVSRHWLVHKIKLDVWDQNLPAQKLYQNLGFVKTGETETWRGKVFDKMVKEI